MGKAVKYRGILILLLSNTFCHAVAFTFRVLLARSISPECMGLYQLVMPVYSLILSFSASGLCVATARMSAENKAVGGGRAHGLILRNALLLFSIVIAVLSVFILPLSDYISAELLGDARTRLSLILLMPCIFLTGFENILKNFFYGCERVAAPATSEAIEQVVRSSLILGLIYFARPAYEELAAGYIILGMLLCEILSVALLCVWYLRTKIRAVPAKGAFSRREMLGIAAPVSGANLATTLFSSVTHVIIPARLIVAGMPHNEALSSYGIAFGMTMPLLAFPYIFISAIGLVMLPLAAGASARGDASALSRRVGQTLSLTMSTVLPFTAILIPLGPPIASALFGRAGAGAYITPLAFATMLSCLQAAGGMLLSAYGQQRRSAANQVVCGIISLALTWYAVAQPSLMLGGFVLAFIISALTGAALNTLDLVKTTATKAEPWRWFGRPALMAAIAYLLARYGSAALRIVLLYTPLASALAVLPLCLIVVALSAVIAAKT